MVVSMRGTVTYIEERSTASGNKYRTVKVLQMDKEGNGATVVVRVWDNSLNYTVGKDCKIDDVSVSAYLNKGKAGMSVDRWGDRSKVGVAVPEVK